MREFSIVSTRLWHSRRFIPLNDFERSVYFYFLTSPHSNSIGAYQCPSEYVAFDLKRDHELAEAAINTLHNIGLIFYNWPEHLVLVTNWIRFNQPTNPNHARKLVNDVLAMPDIPEKMLAIWELLRYSKKLADQDRSRLQIEFETLQSEIGPGFDNLLALYKAGGHKAEPAAAESEDELDFGETLKTQVIDAGAFDKWWKDIYPESGRKKGSKKRAESYFAKKAAKHGVEKITLGTIAYADYLADNGQKNKDAERFLRDECYLDDWSTGEIVAKAKDNIRAMGL